MRKYKRLCDIIWRMDPYGYLIPVFMECVILICSVFFVRESYWDEMLPWHKQVFWCYVFFVFCILCFFVTEVIDSYKLLSRNKRSYAIIKYIDEIVPHYTSSKYNLRSCDLFYKRYLHEKKRTVIGVIWRTILALLPLFFLWMLLVAPSLIVSFVLKYADEWFNDSTWNEDIFLGCGYTNHFWLKCIVKDVILVIGSMLAITAFFGNLLELFEKLFDLDTCNFHMDLFSKKNELVKLISKSDNLQEIDNIIRHTYKKTDDTYDEKVRAVHNKLKYAYLFCSTTAFLLLIYYCVLYVYYGVENIDFILFK